MRVQGPGLPIGRLLRIDRLLLIGRLLLISWLRLRSNGEIRTLCAALPALQLAKLLLELLAIGNIERHANRARDVSIGAAQRLDVASVRSTLPLHMKRHRLSGDGSAVSGNGKKGLVGGFEILQKRLADEFVGSKTQP